MKKTTGFAVRIGALLSFIIISVIFSLNYETNKIALTQFLVSATDQFFVKLFLYFAVGIAINFFFVPLGIFFKLLGGYLFGNLLGFVLSLLVTVFVSYLAMRFSKNFFKIDTQKFNKVINERIQREIAKNPLMTVVRLRLFPLFPLQVTNYLLSNFPLSSRDFIVGSLVGMAPASLIYSYLGDRLNSQIVENLSGSTVLLIGLILCTLLALTYLHGFIRNKANNG